MPYAKVLPRWPEGLEQWDWASQETSTEETSTSSNLGIGHNRAHCYKAFHTDKYNLLRRGWFFIGEAFRDEVAAHYHSAPQCAHSDQSAVFLVLCAICLAKFFLVCGIHAPRALPLRAVHYEKQVKWKLKCKKTSHSLYRLSTIETKLCDVIHSLQCKQGKRGWELRMLRGWLWLEIFRADHCNFKRTARSSQYDERWSWSERGEIELVLWSMRSYIGIGRAGVGRTFESIGDIQLAVEDMFSAFPRSTISIYSLLVHGPCALFIETRSH